MTEESRTASPGVHDPLKGKESKDETEDEDGGDTHDPEVVVKPVKKLDMNSYATRKTIAMGILDIALLVANIEKAKAIIQSGPNKQQFYYFIITLLVLIIIIQIALAFLLLFVGKINLNVKLKHRQLDLWNNVAIMLIVLITVMEIFASSFGSTK